MILNYFFKFLEEFSENLDNEGNSGLKFIRESMLLLGPPTGFKLLKVT